jgi:hypothetical protein
MRIKHLIRSQDFFGHKVELNFDKKGSSHQTLTGGLVGICVRILMFMYIYVKIRQLVLFEEINIRAASTLIDTDSKNDINFQSFKMNFFFKFRDNNDRPRYVEDFKKYF